MSSPAMGGVKFVVPVLTEHRPALAHPPPDQEVDLPGAGTPRLGSVVSDLGRHRDHGGLRGGGRERTGRPRRRTAPARPRRVPGGRAYKILGKMHMTKC